MQAAWRLGVRSLWARRSAAILLIAGASLSSALIAAVACAMASANNAVNVQLEDQLGEADVRVRPSGVGGRFDAGIADRVDETPGVAEVRRVVSAAASFAMDTPALVRSAEGFVAGTTNLQGGAVLVGQSPIAARGELLAGRWPSAPGEVVLDGLLAQRLRIQSETEEDRADGWRFGGVTAEQVRGGAPVIPSAVSDVASASEINARVGVRVGDVVTVRSLRGGPLELEVVGVSPAPPLGGQSRAVAVLEDAAVLAGTPGSLTEIEVMLTPSAEPDAVVEAINAALPSGVLATTTAKIRANLDQNLASGQLGFMLAAVLTFLTASFIIMTGLNTAFSSQERSLAVVRCIGASPRQLAASQLVTGAMVGVFGGTIGIPLGVVIALGLIELFSTYVQTGLVMPWITLGIAWIGAVISGVLGALWPAWRAWRVAPVRAMSGSATKPRTRSVVLALVAGLLGVGSMLAIVLPVDDGQFVFWGYATVGLPLMFTGYFLLCVPVAVLVSLVVGPPVCWMMRLPPRLLVRAVRNTPFRHGFTAGGMMAGLALLVSLWVNGGAVLRDWLGKMNFPDAFAHAIAMDDSAVARVEALPFVTQASGVGLQPVTTDAFGVRALQRYKSTFIGFDPEPFFDMTSLVWVEGERDEALAALERGGAVLVAREFNIAQGLGVGDVFTCEHNGETLEFDIVGVVESPGLELVSKFFSIGDVHLDQAVHAVFGSRQDLADRFGNTTIQLVQMSLSDEISDAEAIGRLRAELADSGILGVGSGRQIKTEIRTYAIGALGVFSAIGIVAMGVACFGVANLIAASIDARRAEFGIVRAIGGSRGMLVRIVLGQAIVIAVTGVITGTLLGWQSALAGSRLYTLLLGIETGLALPAVPVLLGWSAVLILTVAAAVPAVMTLNRRTPVELLSTGRV